MGIEVRHMQSVNYFMQLSGMLTIVLLKIDNVIKIKQEEVKISLKTKRKIFFPTWCWNTGHQGSKLLLHNEQDLC